MLRFTEDGIGTTQYSQAASASGTEYAQGSVELLYIWFSEDGLCFAQQQGFNFSPNYKFEIIDMGEDGYRLDWSEKQDCFNLWNYQNIQNLTAVVGENGSGKSTLLRYLTAAPSMLNKKENDEKLVQVYRIGNSIKIVYKLDKKLEFDAERKCGRMHVSVADQSETDKLLCQQTVILMSNAESELSFVGSDKEHEPIIFAPEKQAARSTAFYRKASGLGLKVSKDFGKLQERIVSEKTAKCFDQLAVAGYYSQVQSGRYLDTNNREVKIGVESPTKWFLIPKKKGAENHEACGETFRTLLLEYVKLSVTKTYKDILTVLWDALCLEVLCLIKDKQQAFDDPALFSEIRKDPFGYLKDHINVRHDGVIEYYRRAQWEIMQLVTALCDFNCESWENLCAIMQLKDLCKVGVYGNFGTQSENGPMVFGNDNDGGAFYGHQSGVARTVVLKRDSKQYRSFCKFVDEQMKMPTSFVLKHLIVRMSTQSSGELAMQNMFSRLRLPPYFEKILGEDSCVIGDNMLLLLDEVDLYMHPEWQRQFLKLLSDGLEQEYRSKHIQVIITTHSPLVLSDIPSDNVVYLKRDGNKCRIVHGPNMEETFGANIFSLLKDSFFISKSLGEFAHARISKVIDDLERLKKTPDDWKLSETCRGHLQLINHIGEPIIRRKLLMMYEEVVDSDPARLDKESLERLVRLLESDHPEARVRLQELLRFLKENEPG